MDIKIVELLNEMDGFTELLAFQGESGRFNRTLRDLRAAIENAMAAKPFRPIERTQPEPDTYVRPHDERTERGQPLNGLRTGESIVDYAKRITRAHADATVEAVRRAQL